jgi:prolyl-tRNA synthetase
MAIAPYHVALLTLGPEPELKKAADELAEALASVGVEVLYDDRDERAGVKFKDADLVGLPLRIAVGRKGLAEGKAEWKLRGDAKAELVPLGEVAARAAAMVKAAR